MRKRVAALGLLLVNSGCASDPVRATGSAPTNSDDIIAVPTSGASATHSRRVEPIQVVSQEPVFDANFPDAQFSYEAPSLPDACASTEFVAQRLPLDVYIMLDRSGSMNIPQALPPIVGGDCNVGDMVSSRWCRTLSALDAFFADGSSEGTGVALQFFPNGTCSDTPPIGHNCCESGACCGGGPDSVAAVELADLATNREALTNAMNEQSPAGVTTPIEAALRGVTTWTRDHVSSGRSMAGLLITDGEPTGCSTNTDLLANIVAQQLAETGIPTFVIGMEGAKFAPLEQIAAAGGAAAHEDHCPSGIKPCHVYSVGSADSAVFAAALEQIKGSVVQCNYALPTPEAGVVDPDELSVVFSTDAETVSLTRTQGPDACADGGFYLDPSGTTLSLCANSCEVLRAAEVSEVRIAVQCLGI